MVKHYSSQLDRTFFALSDPTRRAIVGTLATKGTCSVLELAEPFDISLAAISKHIKLLENAHLVERAREGRVHHLRLCAKPMSEAKDWLENYKIFWNERFDALESYLENGEEADDND